MLLALLEHQAHRPNNLLLWHAIQWHAREGFAELDFGRTFVALDPDGHRLRVFAPAGA